MPSLTPISELDAVNVLLELIGDQPVNTLEVSGNSIVAQARDLLEKTSRDIQSAGLYCNSRYNYDLYPDVDGYIDVPKTVLSLRSSSASRNLAVMSRTTDNRQTVRSLFDLDNNTFIFTSSVKVDLVMFLDFESLSQPARNYVIIKAGRILQARSKHDVTGFQLSAAEELTAKAVFESEEISLKRPNMFKASDLGWTRERW